MPIYTSIEQLIGRTPLLELCRIERSQKLTARLLVKLECFNPAGSVKDRVALSMLDAAEQSGRLLPGGVIIEPTSGNTGIGLAAVCAVRGYRLIIVMPDSMSIERQKLMRAYGAELILTPGASGMRGAIEKAEALQRSLPGSILAGQFDNPANPRAHEVGTGPEIWQDTEGRVDLFIAGVGTGGTLTGVSHYLKKQKPAVRVIAVEPASSAVLSGQTAGAHGLQGIGAGFIPATLDPAAYDSILRVSEEDAYTAARMLAQTEGLLCGISAGAALHAALLEAQKAEHTGKTIVALLPDTGERYLSSPLFA